MHAEPHSRSGRAGVLAAGNFIVDHVKRVDRWPEQDGLARVEGQSKHNGGGPYNVLKDLARLGAPFPLEAAGLIGHDDDGRWILADCAALGITTTQLRQTEAAATSFTDVMSVVATGRRTFFHQAGANALLGPEHIQFSETRARCFYLGYLLLLQTLDAAGPDGRPRAAELLARARAAGLRTILDCVSDPGDRWQSVVLPVLPEVDVLFANDYEAERLTGIRLVDRASMQAAAEALLRQGVREHVVLHVPEAVGAASAGAGFCWQPAVRVPPEGVVGATGAGDALAAGVVLALHDNRPVAEALEWGVCTAASSLRHASASDGVQPIAEALAQGRAWGYRAG